MTLKPEINSGEKETEIVAETSMDGGEFKQTFGDETLVEIRNVESTKDNKKTLIHHNKDTAQQSTFDLAADFEDDDTEEMKVKGSIFIRPSKEKKNNFN